MCPPSSETRALIGQTRAVSNNELAMADGQWTGPLIYLAVNGKVYDATARRDLFGIGGPYEVFAGKDITRALATMQVKAEECNRTDFGDLTPLQFQTLQEWVVFMGERYECVGTYGTPVVDVPAGHGPAKAHSLGPAKVARVGRGGYPVVEDEQTFGVTLLREIRDRKVASDPYSRAAAGCGVSSWAQFYQPIAAA
jgi:membrane-associated progesterone receptor component